ncbi:TPA: hypothetical protein KV183_002779 [Morganella morganii]|nr:hypothetical protein [Morganella morganii]
MNIRCFTGLHKWIFSKVTRWNTTGGILFAELELVCLRCGKTKVVRRRADSE